MDFKWILLFSLVAFVVLVESKKYDKKSKDRNQVENKKTKEYVGKKEANGEPSSQNKEINTDSKQTKEKYSKKSKETQTKSKEFVKDEKKQNIKVKREVQEQPEPLEKNEPVVSNSKPSADILTEQPVEHPKKSNESLKKGKPSTKSEKVRQKSEKNIPRDCPAKEPESHVQSESCWSKSESSVLKDVEVAVESA